MAILRFCLTCVVALGLVAGIMLVGLIAHEVARRGGGWSPFHLPYFDLGFLCCAVFLSVWWIAGRSWAVGARWAGPAVLAPALVLQVAHNLDPDSGGKGMSFWNVLLQVSLVLILPVGLAFVAGHLGEQGRRRREANPAGPAGRSDGG